MASSIIKARTITLLHQASMSVPHSNESNILNHAKVNDWIADEAPHHLGPIYALIGAALDVAVFPFI